MAIVEQAAYTTTNSNRGMRKLTGGLNMARLFLGVLIWGMIGQVSLASAITIKRASKPIVDLLVPHRAVYEITLANKKAAVSVSDVSGRMVFEVIGSPCNGYSQNMRMMTRITDERGKQTLSDIWSSTWENNNAGHFTFSSSHYFDQNLQETVSGSAKRNAKQNNIQVQIKEPGVAALDLPGDVLFPTQHSLAILNAARVRKNLLAVRIYDGSEQGQGFYQTYSFIGKQRPPGKQSHRKTSVLGKKLFRLGLYSLPSWPVAISYFKGRGSKEDAFPSYELSFRLYPNGVSRNLLINYGDFSVKGSLDRIKYLRKSPCKSKKTVR
ncbi:MAG: cell envelope integrity EipB family protein [bacterium]|nr:cell envelope integrity EipB family protein [bacterium]